MWPDRKDDQKKNAGDDAKFQGLPPTPEGAKKLREALLRGERPFVIYQFSRENVERCDFSDFTNRFAVEKLPTGPELSRLMNGLCFVIEGYDHDPRELHAIPEVRRFYSAFHKAWPYWLYFCNLDQDSLKSMVFCCMSKLTALSRDGQQKAGVSLEPMEFATFIAADFGWMNAICARAGLPEQAIRERSRAIFEYFGLQSD